MRKLCMLLFVAALPLFASDEEFLRAWDLAQKARPAQVPLSARIAPANEPGTPLTIRGRVTESDGRTAVRDAIVFAWHTDTTGVYDKRGTPPHSWRLRGWARTDANGAFTFETIRPGEYPGRVTPAHVHFSVTRADGRRYFTNDLEFVRGKPLPVATPVLRLLADRQF